MRTRWSGACPKVKLGKGGKKRNDGEAGGLFWSGNEGRKSEMILRPYTQIPVRAKKNPSGERTRIRRKCQREQVRTCCPWPWDYASESPTETEIGIEVELATTEVVGWQDTDTEQETFACYKAVAQTEIRGRTETAGWFRTGGRSEKVGT